MLEKKNFYINGSWVAPKKSSDIEVINPATEKAIPKPIITTAYKAIPSLWKSNRMTSIQVTNPTGISADANQIRFDIDEIGVINNTVNNAADNTANGYFAMFIIPKARL